MTSAFLFEARQAIAYHAARPAHTSRPVLHHSPLTIVLLVPKPASQENTRILLEDYAPALDDEGQRVCNVVCTEPRCMSHLIDDLLTLSRLDCEES